MLFPLTSFHGDTKCSASCSIKKKGIHELVVIPICPALPSLCIVEQHQAATSKRWKREREREREGEKERRREREKERERERERKRERIPVGLSNPLNERDNLLAVEGTVLL